jgi:rare lipoprotein A
LASSAKEAAVGAPLDQRVRIVRAAAAPILAAASLAACATTGGQNLVSGPPPLTRPERGSPPPTSGAHGTNAPYQVGGRWYYPHAQPGYDEVGLASWYGAKFHNHTTANGEIFNQDGFSAAHPTLPLPSVIEVTNLANGRRVRVRLNDRGPFVDGRILDLSRAAAAELGFEQEGVARVRVRYIGPAPPLASGVMLAAAPVRAVPERSESSPPEPQRAPAPTPILPPYETAGVQPASAPAAPSMTSGPPAIQPPPAPRPPPVPAALAPSLTYTVQAATFRSRENAERAAAMLGDAGRTSIQPIEAGGVTLYRVMVIGFPDEESAAEAWVHVRDAGFPGARVMGPG